MIVDLDWLLFNKPPPIAIIGSGPAGLSLALELERLGRASIVLEAGGEEYSDASQDHYVGSTIGDPYFDLSTARLRMLGGSSNHWGGWVRQLDAHDLQGHPSFPSTGWPITIDDLQPFLASAQEILEVPHTATRTFTDEIDEIDIAIKPPVRFGIKYRDKIESSRLLHLALDTAVVSIEARGDRVHSLKLNNKGREADVAFDTVVLACGGIENSRLLLWSNRVSSDPVVPTADKLGQYWMEHPTFTVGEAILSGQLQQKIETQGYMFFAPNATALHKYGMLNANIRLFRAPISGLSHDAICEVAKVNPAILGNPALDLGCRAIISMSWEQEPAAGNRIELGGEVDAFGVPRPVLYWSKTRTDYSTAKKVLEVFGAALVESGQGIVRVLDYVRSMGSYPPDDELAGYHHMGGTRMAESPRDGIVDANLRVFGMRNLFVAGSSVFPTSGHANPTLTIVQLSLRLAHHLVSRV